MGVTFFPSPFKPRLNTPTCLPLPPPSDADASEIFTDAESADAFSPKRPSPPLRRECALVGSALPGASPAEPNPKDRLRIASDVVR